MLQHSLFHYSSVFPILLFFRQIGFLRTNKCIGGGSNFGIVYEFVIKLHPHQGDVFGGFMVFSPDKISGMVDAFHNLWKQGRNDVYCTIAIAALNPDNIVCSPQNLKCYFSPLQNFRISFSHFFILLISLLVLCCFISL